MNLPAHSRPYSSLRGAIGIADGAPQASGCRSQNWFNAWKEWRQILEELHRSGQLKLKRRTSAATGWLVAGTGAAVLSTSRDASTMSHARESSEIPFLPAPPPPSSASLYAHSS